MKTYKPAAIILITVGIVAPAYQGIDYTTRQKVADLALLEGTAEKTNPIPLAPMVGALAMAGGIALLLIEKKLLRREFAQVPEQERATLSRKSRQSVR